MKKITAILTMLLIAVLVEAQDTTDFARWKESRCQQMQQFKDSVREDYRQFLDQHWQEYELYKSLHRLGAPKSQTQPTPDSSDMEYSSELMMEVSEQLQPSQRLDIADTQLLADYAAEVFSFQFYCREVVFKLPAGLSDQKLEGCKERQVSKYWERMGSYNIKDVVAQVIRKRQDLYLNDWGMVDLVSQLSAQVYPSSKDAQTALSVYLLNKMRYDVRIGKMDDRLVMLMSSVQPIYERPYVHLDGKKYYAMAKESPAIGIHKITTYQNQFPKADIPVNLSVYYSPRIGECQSKTTYCYNYNGEPMKVSVNKALVDFYAGYPQTDLSVYANAAVAEKLGLSLEAIFRTMLNSKSKYESVELLLDYMQQGFLYLTDNVQFGREKTLFCEENFYYKSNDCEDRAVLFSYLVHRLTDLDVVLLEYDGHVATAVCFGTEKVNGDYYKLNNRKYVVCDPTTKGAKVGQLLRKYRSQTPRLVALNTK